MNITLVQTSLFWEQPLQNLEHFEAQFKVLPTTDIILLPEMFTTGFSMHPQGLAGNQAPLLDWLKKQASLTQAAICGSAMIEEGDRFYNRLFFVTPEGSTHIYNKKHLFTLAGEEKVYTAGEESILIEYKDWRIKPLVCYDLRFPVWSRNTEDYDLLLYVANWPERREHAWMSLLQARAIENMCYVAGVNRVGDDGNGIPYSGQSVVHDPLGETILSFEPGQTKTGQVSLDKKYLNEVRSKLGFLRDRDQFTLLS
jgi:predicted amidohydrolase